MTGNKRLYQQKCLTEVFALIQAIVYFSQALLYHRSDPYNTACLANVLDHISFSFHWDILSTDALC